MTRLEPVTFQLTGQCPDQLPHKHSMHTCAHILYSLTHTHTEHVIKLTCDQHTCDSMCHLVEGDISVRIMYMYMSHFCTYHTTLTVHVTFLYISHYAYSTCHISVHITLHLLYMSHFCTYHTMLTVHVTFLYVRITLHLLYMSLFCMYHTMHTLTEHTHYCTYHTKSS